MTRLIQFSDDLHHPEEEVVAEVRHRAVEGVEVHLLDVDHQDVDHHHREGKSHNYGSLD